jgi:hypothetical protein
MLARLAAATVAGGITFFVLGFIIYGLILDPYIMRPNINPDALKIMRDPPMWIPLILANLVSAFLLAYIFDKWATIRTFAGGLIGGATVMFLIALSFQLMFLAFMRMTDNISPIIADIAGSTVLGAIGGGVIGAVLGMMSKNAPAGN